jgi:oligopeptide/dipeptide ABC transporter ATP-binding protein
MLLTIKNLSVTYHRGKENIPAVRDVSFDLDHGQTLGIVGESGCGKSTVALSILKLIEPYEGHIQGEIHFDGENLSQKSEKEIQKIRGNSIGLIFQDPFSSFNPVFPLGEQVAESLKIHQAHLNKNETKQKVLDALKQVQIEDPERIYASYPHQVSGGQRQRVMIAMAMVNQPKLLIADEPTTALDVTIQKEILDLLLLLQKEGNMSMIIITHHFGIVAHYTQKLMVLYGGEIVEEGYTKQVIEKPQHPYTQCLLKSLPETVEGGGGIHPKKRLFSIEGTPPNMTDLPSGCIFHPRCPKAVAECKIKVPPLREVKQKQKAACLLAPF